MATSALPAGTSTIRTGVWNPHALINENQNKLFCAMYGDSSKNTSGDSGDSSTMLAKEDLDDSVKGDPGTLTKSMVEAAKDPAVLQLHPEVL